MRGLWRCAALLAVVTVGCSIRIPVDPPVWAIDPGVPETHDPRLTALAEAIDPGPQAPLRVKMSAKLTAGVDDPREAEVDPRVLAERELREALLHWREAAGDDATLAEVARAVARAEGLAGSGKIHPELAVTLIKAYAQLVVQPADARRMFVEPPEEAAYALLRRTAAALLRRHAAHPDMPDVLAALAEAADWHEEFARAAELRGLQVRALGERAGAEHRVLLAAACYRALTPGCGDAAMRALAAMKDPAMQPTIDELQGLADLAARLGGAAPTDAEGLVARAEGLRGLGRERDAEAALRLASAADPGDARARVLLARVLLGRGEVEAALVEVRAARGLRRFDRDAHELAIGLLWPRLATAERAGAAAELRSLAGSYGRYEAGRAAVLAVVLAAVVEASDGAAALQGIGRAHARVTGLVREFPGSADARRLAYVASRVAPSAEAALAVVRAPLPAGLERDAELEGLRLAAWFDAAVRWDRREELAKILEALARRAADADGELRATTAVARAALAGEPAAATAAWFRGLAEAGTPAEQARALANLAVLTVAEDPEEAIKLWTAALQLGHGEALVRVNMAGALALHPGPPDGLDALLAEQAAATELPALAVLAHAWRVALARATGRGDERSLRTQVTAAWANARRASPGAPTPGSWGMIAEPPAATLEYSDARVRGAELGGLRLTATAGGAYWLVLQPPGLAELLGRRRSG